MVFLLLIWLYKVDSLKIQLGTNRWSQICFLCFLHLHCHGHAPSWGLERWVLFSGDFAGQSEIAFRTNLLVEKKQGVMGEPSIQGQQLAPRGVCQDRDWYYWIFKGQHLFISSAKCAENNTKLVPKEAKTVQKGNKE